MSNTVYFASARAPLWDYRYSLRGKLEEVLSTFAPGKVICLNFALEVQPECDCMPMADTPLVQDQGISASDDIVAVEQATLCHLLHEKG